MITQRQQAIRLRIICGDRASRNVVGPHLEAARGSAHVAALCHRFHFDERIRLDLTRGHVVCVHKDDHSAAKDPAVAIIEAVDRRVVLIVAADCCELQRRGILKLGVFRHACANEEVCSSSRRVPFPSSRPVIEVKAARDADAGVEVGEQFGKHRLDLLADQVVIAL